MSLGPLCDLDSHFIGMNANDSVTRNRRYSGFIHDRESGHEEPTDKDQKLLGVTAKRITNRTVGRNRAKATRWCAMNNHWATRTHSLSKIFKHNWTLDKPIPSELNSPDEHPQSFAITNTNEVSSEISSHD